MLQYPVPSIQEPVEKRFLWSRQKHLTQRTQSSHSLTAPQGYAEETLNIWGKQVLPSFCSNLCPFAYTAFKYYRFLRNRSFPLDSGSTLRSARNDRTFSAMALSNSPDPTRGRRSNGEYGPRYTRHLTRPERSHQWHRCRCQSEHNYLSFHVFPALCCS